MKTDIYTKIVLTVIAVALVGLLVKDVDFVTKAQANPVAIDLSALNIEKAENSNESEMTFFIYENDKLTGGFGNRKYTTDNNYYSSLSPNLKNKDDEKDTQKKAYINQLYDLPKYVITTKKGSFWLER